MKKLFGQGLEELRKGKKLTQAEVAKRLGISVAHYQSVELGRRKLESMEAWLALAQLHGWQWPELRRYRKMMKEEK